MKSYENEDQLMAILMSPYPQDKVRWRIGRAGKSNNKEWASLLAYVDARDVRHRLDEAFGRVNWECTYQYEKDTILCHINARALINGEKTHIQGSDGAGETQVEREKGGISDAFKRAANAAFGVYEYLYELGDTWANIHANGRLKGQYKDGGKTCYFKYDPPAIGGKAPSKAPSKPAPQQKKAPVEAPTKKTEPSITLAEIIKQSGHSEEAIKEAVKSTVPNGGTYEDAEARFLNSWNAKVKEWLDGKVNNG